MKRLLRQFAICLGLGVVVTVGVAWGCTRWVHVREWDRVTWTLSRPPGWSVGRYERAGVRWAAGLAVFEMSDALPKTLRDDFLPYYYVDGQYTKAAEDWFAKSRPWGWPDRFRGEAVRSHDEPLFIIVDARGWPMPALWREGVWNDPGPGLTRSSDRGALIEQSQWRQILRGRAEFEPNDLPLRPLWQPFMLDTLFYAAILWLLFHLVRFASLTWDGWSLRSRWAGLTGCGVLGVVTTVAVAWALVFSTKQVDYRAINARSSWQFANDPLHPFGDSAVIASPGTLWLGARWYRTPQLPTTGQTIVPNWAADFVYSYSVPPGFHSRREVIASGWPLVALWSGLTFDEEIFGRRNSMRTEWGIEIAPAKTRQAWPPNSVDLDVRSRVLPLGPIWLSFAIDSLIYAVAWWALFSLGLTPVLGAWRRGRGRCEKCAYDLRGDLAAGCPECGWRRVASDAPR